MDVEDFVDKWRSATINSADADQAELEIRRILADSQRDVDADPSALNKLARSIGLRDILATRIARKADHERRTDIENLRNYISILETRIKRLEAKAYPGGGG